MVSSRAAEWFDALSTRTGELDDRSHRSLTGAAKAAHLTWTTT